MAEDERRRRQRRQRERAGQQDQPWLSELLDAAAEQYEPDAERLKAMVTARIAQQSDEAEATTTSASSSATTEGRYAASSRSRRSGRRTARTGRVRGLGLIGRLGLAGIPAGVALTTIGAAAALAVGATATIAVTSSHDHRTVTIAAPSDTPGRGGTSSQSAGPSGGASATGTPTSRTTTKTTTSATASASTSTSTNALTASSALVSATPSIDSASFNYWAQLDLVVTAKEPLTALDVTVKVSKCAGLGSTGSWDTGAIGEFTATTTTNADGSITYEFELNHGQDVSPGTMTFAVQFNHAATGWNTADDTFYVSARTATSTGATAVQGPYQG